MLMSVRTALAKLSAAAAGGALVGGAVHVAEPQAATTSYKSAKMVKGERPVKYVKERRAQRVVPPRARRVVEREVPPAPPPQEQFAMVPIPLPPVPQAPIITGGGSPPVIIGGSGGFPGFGGSFGGFFGGGGSGGNVSV